MSNKKRTRKSKNTEEVLLKENADIAVIFNESGVKTIYSSKQYHKVILINETDKTYDIIRTPTEQCFTNLEYILNQHIK